MNQQPWCIGPQPFEVKEENCATEWKRWLRSFELFATASGIKDESKHNWLLHYAGLKVQDIFDNLPDLPEETKPMVTSGRIEFEVEGDNEYDKIVTKLTGYFAPKQSKSYERHMFRQMSQRTNERIDSFVIRLREQANRCEFGEQKDENIKDQITAASHSDLLRRKILERGDQNLDSVMKLARILESVSNQWERNGSEIVVENAETKTEYRRNVAHAKKIPAGGFREPEVNPGDAISKVPDGNSASVPNSGDVTANVPEATTN